MNGVPIFVDANALVDFFLGEEHLNDDAVRLRRAHPFWVTLPLCRYEFGNALRTQIRLDRIDQKHGQDILQQGLGMVNFCREVGFEDVLSEANVSNLTFYDAAYVANARSLEMRLHTRDGKILRNCPDVAVSIADR